MSIVRRFAVVVTGGAPYKSWNYNTSAMIRDKLPNEINRPKKPQITIFKYSEDIPCEYATVMGMMPKIWSGNRSLYKPSHLSQQGVIDIDLMIHIGMSPGATIYRLETRGRRDGYEEPGMDGKYLSPEVLAGLPEELCIELDMEMVAERLNKKLPAYSPIETSNNAGLYFCEFQLYTSLAELWKKHEFYRVGFLHVFDDKSEEGVARGAQATLALIEELVDSLSEAETVIGGSK